MTGRIDTHIHARAVRRLPELVRDLMGDALALWAANSWATYDKLEVNCSSQLYRWLIEAQRTGAKFSVLDIQIEHILLTPAMLSGRESVVKAARPDLRIAVRNGGVLLEAKRLTSTGVFCRKYVDEGMARFVNSVYAASEDWGIMVGYVQQPSAAGLASRINGFVDGHSAMGVDHRLTQRVVQADSEWLASFHNRASGTPIRLDHVWVTIA